MQSLARNKQTLYYATYSGITDVVDADGNLTGEKATSYSFPVKACMNIAPNTGRVVTSYFGNDTNYSHILCTTDMSCPINQNTRVWIGQTPNQSADNWNFVVKRVAKSLNSILIAVEEK